MKRGRGCHRAPLLAHLKPKLGKLDWSRALGTATTAAIIAVHFLPPTPRAGRIGLRIKWPIVAVAVAAVGRSGPAAMAVAVLPPAAPIGDVLNCGRPTDRGRQVCINLRGGWRGLSTQRPEPQAGDAAGSNQGQFRALHRSSFLTLNSSTLHKIAGSSPALEALHPLSITKQRRRWGQPVAAALLCRGPRPHLKRLSRQGAKRSCTYDAKVGAWVHTKR